METKKENIKYLKHEEFNDDSIKFYIKKLLETLYSNNYNFISKGIVKTYSKSLYNVLSEDREKWIDVIKNGVDSVNGQYPCKLAEGDIVNTFSFSDNAHTEVFRRPVFEQIKGKGESLEQLLRDFFSQLKKQGFDYYRISFLRLYGERLYRERHVLQNIIDQNAEEYNIRLLQKDESPQNYKRQELGPWYLLHKSQYRDKTIQDAVQKFLLWCKENHIKTFSPVQFHNHNSETAKAYRILCLIYSSKKQTGYGSRRGNLDWKFIYDKYFSSFKDHSIQLTTERFYSLNNVTDYFNAFEKHILPIVVKRNPRRWSVTDLTTRNNNFAIFLRNNFHFQEKNRGTDRLHLAILYMSQRLAKNFSHRTLGEIGKMAKMPSDSNIARGTVDVEQLNYSRGIIDDGFSPEELYISQEEEQIQQRRIEQMEVIVNELSTNDKKLFDRIIKGGSYTDEGFQMIVHKIKMKLGSPT